MRNVKLRIFILLITLLAVWIGYNMAAYIINVWPQDYNWTLTLNKLYIMKWISLTWIVIDGTWYEISIASGQTNWYWKISVYEICGQHWTNCKQVNKLLTDVSVSNTNNTLTWGQATTIATIEWHEINAKLPANPVTVSNTNNPLSRNSSVNVATIGWQNLNVTLPANPVTVSNTNNPLSRNSSVKVATIWSQDLNVKLPANPATVTNTNNSLSWNTSVKVATIWSQDLNVKLPANPVISNDSWHAGIVANPHGTNTQNKVRKTDENGNPARRDDAWWTLRETTSDGWIKPINHNLTIKSTISTTTLLSNSTNFKVWWENGYIYTKPNWGNYSDYRLWINTADPKATLEVAWSLRVNTTSSYCGISTICNSNTVWSIIYRGNSFWWCTPEWRQKFDMQPHVEDPSSRVNNNCVVNFQ